MKKQGFRSSHPKPYITHPSNSNSSLFLAACPNSKVWNPVNLKSNPVDVSEDAVIEDKRWRGWHTNLGEKSNGKKFD